MSIEATLAGLRPAIARAIPGLAVDGDVVFLAAVLTERTWSETPRISLRETLGVVDRRAGRAWLRPAAWRVPIALQTQVRTFVDACIAESWRTGEIALDAAAVEAVSAAAELLAVADSRAGDQSAVACAVLRRLPIVQGRRSVTTSDVRAVCESLLGRLPRGKSAVIRTLATSGVRRMRCPEIADQTDLTSGGVRYAARRLEDAGIVETQKLRPGRSFVVYAGLTRHGRDLVRRIPFADRTERVRVVAHEVEPPEDLVL